MPWQNNDPEKRRRDAEVYRNPEYLKNRPRALRRAGGQCEECGTRSRPLQVDHRVPVAQGGGHDMGNLQVLCSGQNSCHARKTATEGGGYRKRGDAVPRDPEPRPRTAW